MITEILDVEKSSSIRPYIEANLLLVEYREFDHTYEAVCGDDKFRLSLISAPQFRLQSPDFDPQSLVGKYIYVDNMFAVRFMADKFEIIEPEPEDEEPEPTHCTVCDNELGEDGTCYYCEEQDRRIDRYKEENM